MIDQERKVVLDNEHITVWILPAVGIVHHQIHRYTCGEPLRRALMAGALALEDHGATKWLSDDRGNNALPQGDLEWARVEWFPRVRKAGWRHWAIVQPEKVLGQMNLRRIADTYAEQGVLARMFSDPDDAMGWLLVQRG